MGNVAIGRGLSEKRFFCLDRLLQTLIDGNILLTAIDGADEAKFQGINSSSQDFKCIRTMVHQIEFGEHTDRPLSHRVNLSRQFKSLGVDEIDIRGRHSEDNTFISARKHCAMPIWFCNILDDKSPNLLLDIGRLVSNRDLCQTGQVHQCEVQHIRTENLQMNGKSIDALVESRDTRCLGLDFPPDGIKVCETVAGRVEKFSPFGFEGSVLGIIRGGANVDELEDEGTTGDDAGATR
jgi:hypothetical protein